VARNSSSGVSKGPAEMTDGEGSFHRAPCVSGTRRGGRTPTEASPLCVKHRVHDIIYTVPGDVVRMMAGMAFTI
jgi:hypothetical protein